MEIDSILEKLQDMEFLRLDRIRGDYYTIYCPIHKDGQESKPSCGILLRDQYKNGQKYPKGFCHCFTCGYAKVLPDLVSDLLKKKHIDKSGAEWLKENIPGFEEEVEYELLLPENIQQSIVESYNLDILKKLKSKKQEYISEEELQSYRFTVPYMYQRKLTDEIIEKFDVGFDPNFIPPGRKKPLPCITIPIRDSSGNTLFFCRRSIEGKFFHYPTGVTKPVFGLDMIPKGTSTVIICESCINALTCWVYGYPAVALLGTGNSFQMSQLKKLGVKEYIICMDGDDAGRRSTEKLRKNLSTTAIIYSVDMLPGKDVNDCTKEEFETLLANKS